MEEQQSGESVTIKPFADGGSREEQTEKAFQRALAKLVPGSAAFRELLRSRRIGRAYQQPLMFWASKGRSRGRN